MKKIGSNIKEMTIQWKAWTSKMTTARNITRTALCLVLLCVFLVSLIGCAPAVVPNEDGHLRVHYLDVGQSDCALAEFSRDFTMLIDTSDAEHASDVCDYVKALGYTEIDVIVISHAHADHIGGASSIIEEFEVGMIYIPEIDYTTPEYEQMISSAEQKNVRISNAELGVEFDLGAAKCSFLSPSGKVYEDENDGSAVLRIVYGERAFLFMGDCGIEAEEDIIEASSDVSADVVKVGHHGSNGSSGSDFVRATGAEYAIISCSADNEYGHPSPYAVDRWQSIGACVFATDEHSTVIASTDGETLLVAAATDREFWETAEYGGEKVPQTEKYAEKDTVMWILNTESHIIHKCTCPYALKMNEKVREESAADIDLLEAEGFGRCKHCFSE